MVASAYFTGNRGRTFVDVGECADGLRLVCIADKEVAREHAQWR